MQAKHLDYRCSEAVEEVIPPLRRSQWGRVETGEIASSPWSSVRADLCHTRTCTSKYCGIYRANCSLVRARHVSSPNSITFRAEGNHSFLPQILCWGRCCSTIKLVDSKQGLTIGHTLLSVLYHLPPEIRPHCSSSSQPLL